MQVVAVPFHGREISPPFADVAIRRWEKATGKVAALDGRTFASVQADRAKEAVS